MKCPILNQGTSPSTSASDSGGGYDPALSTPSSEYFFLNRRPLWFAMAVFCVFLYASASLFQGIR